MAYGAYLWAGKARAQKWREAHPAEAKELRREAEQRDRRLAQKQHEVPTQKRQAGETGGISGAGAVMICERNEDAQQGGTETQGEHGTGTFQWEHRKEKSTGEARDKEGEDNTSRKKVIQQQQQREKRRAPATRKTLRKVTRAKRHAGKKRNKEEKPKQQRRSRRQT
jgi:hypothetical protein